MAFVENISGTATGRTWSISADWSIPKSARNSVSTVFDPAEISELIDFATPTGKELLVCNMESSSLTNQHFRGIVPFATREFASIDDIRDNLKVRVGGTVYHCFWSQFGVPYREGHATDESVRWAVVEWNSNMPAGPNTKTTAEIVYEAGANNEPTFDMSGVPLEDFELTVSYTETLSGTPYSIDLFDTILGSNPNNSSLAYLTHDGSRMYWQNVSSIAAAERIGGRKLIRAEAYFGRGRHHEVRRVSGFNTNSAAVETQGNIHVIAYFEICHDDTFMNVYLNIQNDMAYPYPSEPPDNGATGGTNHSAPTQVNTIESPLVQHITDMQVSFTAGSHTLYSAPWFVNNFNTGQGPFGVIDPVGSSVGNDWNIPIQGLGDLGGWGCAFTVSFASQAEADRVAQRPYSHIAFPTIDTWRNARKRGAYNTTVNVGVPDIPGWELPLMVPDQSLVDAWFAQGQGRHANWLSENWGYVNYVSGNPWNNLGGITDPFTASGSQKQFGYFQEGRAFFGPSPWDLYIETGESIREFTARPDAAVWGIEHMPNWYDYPTTNRSSFLYCYGSSIHRLTTNRMGRYTSTGAQPSFGGVQATRTNPDPQYGTTQNNQMNFFDHAHFGTRQAVFTCMLTQNPLLFDRSAAFAECARHYFTDTSDPQWSKLFSYNPADTSTRGEVRPLHGSHRHWLLSGEDRFKDVAVDRLVRWVDGPSWWNAAYTYPRSPGPIGVERTSNTRARTCGDPATEFNIQSGACFFSPWQSAHAFVFMLNWAWEYWENQTFVDYALTAAQTILRAALENSLLIDTAQISSAAERTVDGCWSVIATTHPDTSANGERDLINRHRFAIPRFVFCDYNNSSSPPPRLGRADTSGPWDLQLFMTNNYYANNTGAKNGGENVNWYPMVRAFPLFTDLVNVAGLQERADFIERTLRDVFPEVVSGAAYDSNGGYMCDTWQFFAAQSAGYATVQGTLGAIVQTLGGTINAQAGTTGGLTAQNHFEPLAGGEEGSARLSGDLTDANETGEALRGTSSGYTSSSKGSLKDITPSSVRDIYGTIDASGSSSGGLLATGRLAGTINASGRTDTTFLKSSVVGEVDGASSTDGDLQDVTILPSELQGTTDASASTAGVLVTSAPIAGSSSGETWSIFLDGVGYVFLSGSTSGTSQSSLVGTTKQGRTARHYIYLQRKVFNKKDTVE